MTTTTYFEQKLCDFKVAVGTSVMERNEATVESQIRIKGQIQVQGFSSRRCVSPFVLGVNISPVLEEQLNDADSVVAGSQVEWRGLEEKRVGQQMSSAGGFGLCCHGTERLMKARSGVLQSAGDVL